MAILWWHWIVLGLTLIGLELIVPSFTIIWFGLGAFCVGLLMKIFNSIPLSLQLALWSFLSILFTVLWFRYLKPANRTRAGLSKEGIVGESGTIIRGTTSNYEHGVVRFRISVLGADEWSCYSDEILNLGDTVRVIDIEGQILKVTKV